MNYSYWKSGGIYQAIYYTLDGFKAYIERDLPDDLNYYGGDDREEADANFNLMADQFEKIAVMIRAAVSSRK